MLDLGFEGPVREILSKFKVAKEERCTFMFSATFPTEIQKLAQDFLNRYLFLTVGIVGGANTDVEQVIYKTTQFEKRNKLLEILNEVGNERIMIFLEHKKQADIIAFFLCQKNYPATSIHGDRLQSQRELALHEFKTGKSKIIVCTSVAARGLDISDVNHVINYDLPQTIDEYVHRIGRTGRCGNIGKSVSFFDIESENDKKLSRNLIKILQQAGKQVPDWLESLGDDAFGATFSGASGHTKDIRSFKSLAIDDSITASAAVKSSGADEDW
jgi:probable ATP-dependent RNA helicase DDX4